MQCMYVKNYKVTAHQHHLQMGQKQEIPREGDITLPACVSQLIADIAQVDGLRVSIFDEPAAAISGLFQLVTSDDTPELGLHTDD